MSGPGKCWTRTKCIVLLENNQGGKKKGKQGNDFEKRDRVYFNLKQ